MMTLQKIRDIACDVFSDACVNYDGNYNDQIGYVLTYEPEVVVENSESGSTHTIHDVFLRFEWGLHIQPGEVPDVTVEKLIRTKGQRSSITAAELSKNYAQSHFRTAVGWSEICLGATELNEIYSELRHGENIGDEDKIFYLMFMFKQLLQIESEEGGPHHYFRRVYGFEEDMNSILGTLRGDENSIIPDDELLGELAEHFEVFSVRGNTWNTNVRSSLFEAFFEGFSDQEIRSLVASLWEERFRTGPGLSASYLAENLTFLIRYLQEHNTALEDLVTSFEAWALDQGMPHPVTRPFTIRFFESDNIKLAIPSDDPIRLSDVFIRQRDLEFKSAKIFFGNEFVKKEIIDSDLLTNIDLPIQSQTFTYHGTSYVLIHYLLKEVEKRQEAVGFEDLPRYAESLVAEARR